MPALAAAAWLGALLARSPGPLWPAATAAFAIGGSVLVWRRRGRAAGLTLLAAILVGGAVATAAGVRAARVSDNPLAALGRADASVTVFGTVVDDPRLVQGRFAQEVMVRVEVTRVRTGATTLALREPVLVFGSPAWSATPLGVSVEVTGRLSPSDGGDVAAILSTHEGPDIRAGPDPWWRASARMRQALRDSAARLPPDRRVLVPALVDGDDAGLDQALVDDFRTTGLTHLLAVSGTNLTLVVGFLLVVARWLRVRGRWLYVVGAGGIAGFVLLARAEPSVVRAAAMGTVALIGLGSNGTDRGTRALGVATVVLLLVDPGLAVSVGFALSVLATAGILLLAPAWRDALDRWLPRWLAEAIAVPAAAQLACTPLIAAISGQVSLVAVAANLLAAPAVGPATVLGLVGGALTLVWPPAGRLVAMGAGWFVGWIVTVARHGAAVPTAAIGWRSGPMPLAVLTALSLVMALGAPRLLRRRTTGAACAAALALTVLVRLPTPGWPPDGWLMVMCDVGHQNIGRGPQPRPEGSGQDRVRMTPRMTNTSPMSNGTAMYLTQGRSRNGVFTSGGASGAATEGGEGATEGLAMAYSTSAFRVPSHPTQKTSSGPSTAIRMTGNPLVSVFRYQQETSWLPPRTRASTDTLFNVVKSRARRAARVSSRVGSFADPPSKKTQVVNENSRSIPLSASLMGSSF
jgi:competence protein ComEC